MGCSIRVGMGIDCSIGMNHGQTPWLAIAIIQWILSWQPLYRSYVPCWKDIRIWITIYIYISKGIVIRQLIEIYEPTNTKIPVVGFLTIGYILVSWFDHGTYEEILHDILWWSQVASAAFKAINLVSGAESSLGLSCWPAEDSLPHGFQICWRYFANSVLVLSSWCFMFFFSICVFHCFSIWIFNFSQIFYGTMMRCVLAMGPGTTIRVRGERDASGELHML